jgi:Putative transmembrane protein (Alph_Pro_TM)
MRKNKILLVLLGIGMVFVHFALPLPAQASALKINPPHLDIDTFFSGRLMSLSGSIPSNRDVVIEIIGPDERTVFNMKGRVGPFWMNRGKVEIDKAPFLYMLLLPERKEWHGSISSIGLGIERLKRKLVIRPGNVSLDIVFPRFVQLKRSEHLYGELEGAIRYSQSSEGMKHFEAKFFFPSSAHAGEYRILDSVLHDGKVEETALHDFTVEEVGFIKTVREFAYDRGLLYGIFCVFIALFVGAVIGFFFKGRGAH